MLWHCWLGGRKGIQPVKTKWWGAGVVICLERVADLHIAQLMPLPLTVSCSSKIQIGFTFLVPADPGSPGKRAVKWVCVTSACVGCSEVYLGRVMSACVGCSEVYLGRVSPANAISWPGDQPRSELWWSLSWLSCKFNVSYLFSAAAYGMCGSLDNFWHYSCPFSCFFVVWVIVSWL